MQNLTYETLTAIEDMRKAMEKICDLCLEHDEVNDAISGAQYPFEESLDEVAMQVNLWLEEVEGVLNHYDSENVRDGIFA